MHVMDNPNAFITNRDKLCISPKVAEMVYNKVGKIEVIGVVTIQQELKAPKV